MASRGPPDIQCHAVSCRYPGHVLCPAGGLHLLAQQSAAGVRNLKTDTQSSQDHSLDDHNFLWKGFLQVYLLLIHRCIL